MSRKIIANADTDEQRKRSKRSRKTEEILHDTIEKYRRIHGSEILISPAYYYGTVEAKLAVEQAENHAIARVVTKRPKQQVGSQKIIGSAFELAVGDVDFSGLGGVHVVNDADTNLQNAGMTLYCDELFLMEAVTARVRGIRVKYDPEDLRLMKLPVPGEGGGIARDLLSGKIPIQDETEKGLVTFLEEMGTPLTPELGRLCKQLPKIAGTSSLHFLWRDVGIGGSETWTDAMIATFSDVPGSMSPENERTPFDLMQGYIWVLDKHFQATCDSGGNGLFDVELHLDEEVGILFNPMPVFGLDPATSTTKTRGAPVGFSVIWEVRVHGTSLLPGREAGAPRFRELMGRRKRE